MLHVCYSGKRSAVQRYQCRGAHVNHGENWCISFGGLRPDEAVAREVLRAISGNAVEAALEAAEKMREQRQAQRRVLELEVEQSRYETRLAARRYEAVDPENRLVASELEIRWNAALRKETELVQKLQGYDLEVRSIPMPDRQLLLSLAQDLPALWNSPTSDMRLKQRIIRIIIQEIVADVDEKNSEIVFIIHWAGDRHSELRLKKNDIGRHRYCTNIETMEVIRKMCGKFTDEQIATTLNRLGLRTGNGKTWNENRVYSLRHYHQLPAYDSQLSGQVELTLEEAAKRLGVSPTSIRRMIAQKKIPASQVVRSAPWQIPSEPLASPEVQRIVQDIKERRRIPQTTKDTLQLSMFSSI
jgi:excisionase family DNA binding protein